MSSATPEQPRSHKEAKADAKAAAAYAKAQRPWYKKKRFILSLGLLLLIIVIAAGSSGGGSGGGGSSGGGGGTSGAVGQALTNAGTTYKVTDVKTASTLGDPALGGAKADGIFVVVSLELTNNKSETKTFSDGSAKIVSADGKEYSTSSNAILALGAGESLLLKEIQPSLTTRGKLVFDVPPSKLSRATLVIQDLFGDGEIKVNLGL